MAFQHLSVVHLETTSVKCSLKVTIATIQRLLKQTNLKAHANGRNKKQHCLVLLGVFGQQCFVRLHGPKSLTSFKLYATSAIKCQHCCSSMQTEVTCWAQQCCVLLANNFASVCIGLSTRNNVVTCYVRLHRP